MSEPERGLCGCAGEPAAAAGARRPQRPLPAEGAAAGAGGRRGLCRHGLLPGGVWGRRRCGLGRGPHSAQQGLPAGTPGHRPVPARPRGTGGCSLLLACLLLVWQFLLVMSALLFRISSFSQLRLTSRSEMIGSFNVPCRFERTRLQAVRRNHYPLPSHVALPTALTSGQTLRGPATHLMRFMGGRLHSLALTPRA